MAEYTTNLNLEKPEGNENFRRAVINSNMDMIDTAVGNHTKDLSPHQLTLSALQNGQYAGEVIMAVMAAGCAVYDLLYISASGYNRAQANNVSTLPCVGVCLESGTGEKKVLKRGYIRNSSWNFTKGALAYVSPSIAGGITTARPANPNQIQVIGYFEESNTLYFDPQLYIIEPV